MRRGRPSARALGKCQYATWQQGEESRVTPVRLGGTRVCPSLDAALQARVRLTMPRVSATRTIENALRRAGFGLVAGTDEVGRGCLAGPVTAGVVILNPDRHIPGLSDSKAVPADERADLYDEIVHAAIAWAVASSDPRTIDRLNIHQASLDAMRRAVLALTPLPDMVLVDAFHIPDIPMPQRGVKHGDRRCAAIAAASIVAKVTRDREMVVLHEQDPRYGFNRHKGYATADHLAAVARFGYSDAHRRSFRASSLFDTMA